MAEAIFSQDEFLCSVCLDLLKDPVTTSCGHNYCESCITDCWDQEDQKRVYSCPQCRQTFSPRPALARNTVLAEVVEKLKKTKLPADCYAGAGDVQCDVCTGRKYKAVKSCLVCLNSYCQNHLEQHESLFKGKRHNLTDATGRLQEMICQKHEKLLEAFCRTDQKCICMMCTIIEHKNHDIVSAAEQRTEKQVFKSSQVKSRIQQREKDLQQLREASAQTAVEDSERIFTELIRSIERSHSELIRLIRDQEKTAVKVIDSAGVTDVFPSFDEVVKSVSQLRDKLQQFCVDGIQNMSKLGKYGFIFRKEFIKYKLVLTLDLNTVNKLLRLSKSNRVITNTGRDQPYPGHPDRFDVWQVLCRESVCGRCYWEIEWSGDYGVCISVSYKSISRKGRGNECLFGCNDQSWSLICSSSSYSFLHNNIRTALSVESISRRIGVFVDHSAGTLSFYSVSDTMILIHSVPTTFTRTLYPGFYVFIGSSVKLMDCIL
uniref:Tripartite motif-containing protein 16-like n=1 Tax=Sinocyclocheilus grahami TaxID=75366 RepID=A0A672NZI3_SINGR